VEEGLGTRSFALSVSMLCVDVDALCPIRLSDVVSMDFVLLSLEPVTLSAINSGTLRRGAIPGVVSAVEGRGKNTVVSVQVARSRWQEISASVSFSSTASSPRTNS
jgi:hypothetical protein